MKQRAAFRRAVGAILIATLAPWMTGCYNLARFSPAASAAPRGKKVHVKCRAPATINVVMQDGSRSVLEHVVEAEGALALANADSVRLTNAVATLSDKSQSKYREAAFAVSQDMSTDVVRLDPVRTALLVVGVSFVTVALIGVAAFHDLDYSFPGPVGLRGR